MTHEREGVLIGGWGEGASVLLGRNVGGSG
jgi:hypothetical protein